MGLAEAMRLRGLKNVDVAVALSVSPEAVRLWKLGARHPRREYLAQLQELTGLSRSELRPDIFGDPSEVAA